MIKKAIATGTRSPDRRCHRLERQPGSLVDLSPTMARPYRPGCLIRLFPTTTSLDIAPPAVGSLIVDAIGQPTVCPTPHDGQTDQFSRMHPAPSLERRRECPCRLR